MGCDIHLHTEVKINGTWHHYSTPAVPRWYLLFARMANVRNYEDVEPIAEPRGLPQDATALTLFDAERWGPDGHSHSYLSAEEIAELVQWVKDKSEQFKFEFAPFWESNTFGFVFGNNWSGFSKYPADRPEGLEDVRFVFWFDN